MVNGRALIAEDDPSIVESLSFILERGGFTVEAVLDGETALRRLDACSFDVMILDIMLPKINGLEVLKHVRSQDRHKNLPIIILSAKGQAQDRHTAELIGADLYVTKPFSNKDIVAAAQRLANP